MPINWVGFIELAFPVELKVFQAVLGDHSDYQELSLSRLLPEMYFQWFPTSLEAWSSTTSF